MSEKWSKIGAALWEEAVPIAATLSETYLRSRGISLSFSPDIVRHHSAASHPKLKTKMPALIVKVSGSAEPSFGFTWLAPDGRTKAPIDKKEQRRTLGSNKGGAVQLAEPQPGKSLLIGEGFETVATAIEATGLPGWATLGTAFLPDIDLPEGLTEAIHLAENDDNGANQRALDKACPILIGRGIKNRVAQPPAGYKDLNDLLKGNGVDRGSGLMIVKMAVESAGDWQPKKAKAKEEPDPSEGTFVLDEAGLHQRKSQKWDWISQPFEVLGLARDAAADGETVAGWGKLVRFRDPDGRTCEEIVTTAMLHDDPNALISQLADRGMTVKCTLPARRAFAEYLASVDADQRVTVARRIGWIEIGKQRAFVLPSEIIGGDLHERIILVKEAGTPYGRGGTLEDWRDAIAARAGDHLMLRFAIATGFTGPLLLLGGFESGLSHLYGPSSVGKTTLLRIAASVWGSGADGGYVRTWRTTANALEATLASACDTLLLLDEIGQADGREIGLVVYMIAGTVGKARMRRDASLKPSHKWRTMGLSSGETPIAARIGEDQRVKRAHAGQLVRAIDIPARRAFGVFDQAYTDFDPKAFPDEMKRAASNCYGTAGPEFVRGLIERRIGAEGVRKLVADFVEEALAGTTDNHGQAARAAERFGLIAAAGRLAAEFGLVPWPKDQSAEDTLELFKAWLRARGGAQPAEIRQMIAQVQRFMEAHGDARFDDLDPPPKNSFTGQEIERRPVTNRAGYRRGEGDGRRWLVLPQVWRDEICAGFDPREVAKVLAGLSMLESGDGGKHSQSIRISGAQKTQRFYVLTSAVFEGWGDEETANQLAHEIG